MNASDRRARSLRFLTAGPRYIVGSLMLVIAVLINVEVVLRYFFNLPIGALSELIILLFPWLALLGAAVALDTAGANVTLQLLDPHLSPRGRTIIRVLVDLTAFAFGIFLMLEGTDYAEMTSGELTNVLAVSMSWDTVAFPVAGALFVIYSLHSLARLLRRGGEAHPALPGDHRKRQ
jgi:TRAP-type C4-dicarboxylate transport system permease small subunit